MVAFFSLRRAARVAIVGLPIGAVLVSCGGVYTEGTGGGGGSGAVTTTGGANAGGTTGTGGTFLLGGTTSTGGGTLTTGGSFGSGGFGATGGFAGGPNTGGFAGLPATGGFPGCFGAPCPAPFCPPGSGTHVPQGQCCPVCGPDCGSVDCGLPNCPPGFAVEYVSGQCCPMCTPIPSVDGGVGACDQGGYASLVGQLAQKFAQAPCATSADCTLITLSLCGFTDCGTAVPTAYASTMTSSAKDFAANNCWGCGTTSGACPPVYYTAECVNGVCSRVP